ncbi:acyl-CoA thioesterase [Cryobacterium roopkundense]|uniref:Acyl-CoA thioester hydrolase n=1 Tax=Cryobacterium roopkundense TaxID=1001240 RepID=A0A7W8ZZE5_9MICO|nr:thioesterase family protein [Cryobacterium roopkundense]MBB5642927.1 acyl-CoA thioester hydrolase [Cryobacterium roopkundense]
MTEPFRARVGVRWSDQDLNGHVNNARVATLLEEARMAWRTHALTGYDHAASPTVVAALQLSFLRPIEFGPDVEIDVWVGRVGSKSYTLRYSGVQAGLPVLDASTVMVPVHPVRGESRPLDAEERTSLARWLIAAAPQQTHQQKGTA